MTAREMAALIGREGGYRVGRDLQFEILVLDARTRFGSTDVLIGPKAGNGSQWVALDSVTLN